MSWQDYRVLLFLIIIQQLIKGMQIEVYMNLP